MTNQIAHEFLAIASHDLTGVSGGTFRGPSAKKQAASALGALDGCDDRAEKNHFDQPVDPLACYKGVLDEYSRNQKR